MDTRNTEQIIEIVRKNKCIYDHTDKFYKNVAYKLRLWEKIAQQIKMPSAVDKAKWKCLRDGYLKYKKNIVGQTGSEQRNYSYCWAEHLSFLDDSIKPRSTSSNISLVTEENIQYDHDYAGLSTDIMQTDIICPETANLSSPVTSFIDACDPLHSIVTQCTSPTSSEATTTPVDARRQKPETDVEKALNYLKNKKKDVYDGVDHLFLSYASTFKNLTRYKQAQIKIQLATLFAEAELSELNNNLQMVPQQTSHPDVPSSSKESNQLPEDLSKH